MPVIGRAFAIACVLSICGACAATTDATDSDSDDLTKSSCTPISKRTTPLEVSVLPDASDTPFVDVLDKAQSSIRVFIYQLGEGNILDKLVEKAKQKTPKVDVRVIADKSQEPVNAKFVKTLTDAGAKVEWSDPQFSFMHAKVLVVDANDAVVSTGNYPLKEIQDERNFVAHDSDTSDVKTLVSLFDADWSRQSPSEIACTRLLVSPINSKQRILDLIDGATKTITIESMQFADLDVRGHVLARQGAGVEVRAILAAPSWIAANTEAGKFLVNAKIPAKYMTAPKVHVKSISVDGKRAYIGSENLSLTSLTKNREVGLIVTELANVKTITSTFEKDWAAATDF